MENGLYSSSSSDISPVSSIAPSDEAEIKKLKNIVKKLKKQNRHLKHKGGNPSPRSSREYSRSKHLSNSLTAGSNAHSHVLPTFSYIDVEVIDENDPNVINVLTGDQYSWLYKSPKYTDNEPDDYKYSCPEEWLKDEFDHPRSPELSFAKRIVMLRLNGPYSKDRIINAKQINDKTLLVPKLINAVQIHKESISGETYLRQSAERRLIYPLENHVKLKSVEVQQSNHFQPHEIKRSTNTQDYSYNLSNPEFPETAATKAITTHSNQKEFRGEDYERNSFSPGSTLHHLPVPSQTRTTVHGLAHLNGVAEGRSRSRTPTTTERYHHSSERSGKTHRSVSPVHISSVSRTLARSERSHQPMDRSRRAHRSISPSYYESRTTTKSDRSNHERVGRTHRSISPSYANTALGSSSVRRSSPSPSRNSNYLAPPSSTTRGRQQSPHRPIIKSNLVATERVSRLQQKGGLPAPHLSSGMPSGGTRIRPHRSPSPMTSQRRQLPIPSQTIIKRPSTSPRPAPQKLTPTPSDIWGDDDDVY